ncbi:MAG: multiple sugar transport system permease protein [Phycisphaerales bacterium]|nr:multiple sugar transport system permease protein [Phycisphaerales bacterium]
MTTTIQSPPKGSTAAALSARPVLRAPTKAPGFRTIESISRSERVIAHMVLIAGSILFLVPFYFVVNASLKSEAQVSAGEIVSPASPLGTRVTVGGTTTVQGGLGNYPRALAPDKMNFWPALSNTVVITAASVVGQVLSCSLVGFGFARFRFPGRGLLFMVMLSTLMLPAQVVMIPVFILFRTMGMIDTFWPLVIPMWLASPFFVFMFRQFFAQIPETLIEAARIDGAGNFRIYWQLMLPLSMPVVAIVAIYTFLFAWNDFLSPLIYLNSPENRTLALALNAFRGQYGTSDAHLLMAASVVCMAPCILLFFAAQRYFVQSAAMTGMKD